MATRMQQRLLAKFKRTNALVNDGPFDLEAALLDMKDARAAYLGDCIYRRNQSRITPIHAAVRDHGMFATARQSYKAGVAFVDFYCGFYGVMPKGSWK